MSDVCNRRVLIEKNPLKVKIAFKDIRIVRDDLWWYAEQFGEFFYVKEAPVTEFVFDIGCFSDLTMTIRADEIFLVSKGEFAGNIINKNDCKIISGN